MTKAKPSKFPNTVYRVSAKAVIKNPAGQVLVVREQHRGANIKAHRWELPGGGIDHGETIEEALKRELKEELGVSDVKIELKLLGNNIRYVDLVPTYKFETLYSVKINGDFKPITGEDVKEIAWKDPAEFKNAKHPDEQLIYKFGS